MYNARTIYNKRFAFSDIKIDPHFEGQWLANSDYNEQVSQVWKEKEELAKKDGVEIWDGMYYRVANLSQIEESGQLKFQLGTVPY